MFQMKYGYIKVKSLDFLEFIRLYHNEKINRTKGMINFSLKESKLYADYRDIFDKNLLIINMTKDFLEIRITAKGLWLLFKNKDVVNPRNCEFYMGN